MEWKYYANSYCETTIKVSENNAVISYDYEVISYGKKVISYCNAVISYSKKTVSIFDNEIPFVGSAESRNSFVNYQCLVADFIYKSKSDKRKLRRKNQKSRNNKSCMHIVNEFAESESNSRVDSLLVHDQVEISVVIKTKAKTKPNRRQERQKETVHILSDLTVPANGPCICKINPSRLH